MDPPLDNADPMAHTVAALTDLFEKLSLAVSDPPPDKAEPAAHRVFAIAELFEAIIGDLPMPNRTGIHIRSKIGILRVCRHWNTLIRDSPRILQPFFAKFAIRGEDYQVLLFPQLDAEYNQLLRITLWHWLRDPKDSAWKSPHASWRKLSVYFPAARFVSIIFDSSVGKVSPHCSNIAGVTLGDVCNALEEFVTDQALQGEIQGGAYPITVYIDGTEEGLYRTLPL